MSEQDYTQSDDFPDESFALYNEHWFEYQEGRRRYMRDHISDTLRRHRKDGVVDMEAVLMERVARDRDMKGSVNRMTKDLGELGKESVVHLCLTELEYDRLRRDNLLTIPDLQRRALVYRSILYKLSQYEKIFRKDTSGQETPSVQY